MSEETESVEVPNWLKELEAKRERRLKAKLGHEAGAGAPCLTCDEKCPGLDLHFWRKICKNCKCAKENHDVHDDDIYGWAQFQLLGSKPNKSRKFKITGSKGEIELEWTPKGHNDTVDKYLRTMPPELLPVKGSAAAQERKQLLQKQIPIHDIDPTLCHELTDAELKQMNDYIAHVKQNSVGTGHLIQLNRNGVNPQVEISRAPKLISNVQPVKLQGADSASLLKNKSIGDRLQNLAIHEQKLHKIPEDSQQSIRVPLVNDLQYPVGNYDKQLKQKGLNYGLENKIGLNLPQNIPNMPSTPLESNQNPVNANVHKIRNIFGESNANYENLGNETEKIGPILPHTDKSLPHYAPTSYNRFNEIRTPQKIGNIRDLAFSTYDPSKIDPETLENNRNVLENTGNNFTASTTKLSKNLPRNYSPNHLNLEEDIRDPSSVNIGSISDICYPVNEVKTAEQVNNDIFENDSCKYGFPNPGVLNSLLVCHRCKKPFAEDAIVIGIERSEALFHSSCFKCAGCNQNLADLVYFYSKENDDIYCGRDYAKIRGIPRCKACDELIFVKEYCLAENSTFHVKHFCCFECDMPLAGQNYLMEDAQPLCLPCYDKLKANKCSSCQNVIKPDETGVVLKDVHFHASDFCFACKVCAKPLLGSKFLFRNEVLYCSGVCYGVGK